MDAPAPAPGRLRSRIDRVRLAFDAAPLPLRLLIVVACCVLALPVALLYAPVALAMSSRSIWATAAVTMWGVVLVAGLAPGTAGPHFALLVLPVLAAFLAHAGALGRWYVPCRTLAWVIALGLLPGIALFALLDHGASFIGPGLAWLVAFVVLGWRTAKAWQDDRQSAAVQQIRGGAPGPAPRAGGPP
ncbi:MAG: hypothetical protein ACYCU3_11920, partial [Streptosporangiaceae bacterium]